MSERKLVDLERLSQYNGLLKQYISKEIENNGGGGGGTAVNVNLEKGSGQGSTKSISAIDAIGEDSIALGAEVVAGVRGYYYSYIDFDNKAITLAKEQGLTSLGTTFETNYEVGDIISLINNSRYVNCATITVIEENIIYVDTLPFKSIVVKPEPTVDDYSFYVIKKPLAGEVSLGCCSSAMGEGTQALGRASHSEGKDTVAHGEYSHAEGENTIAEGWSSHAEGILTQAGYCAHAEGRSCEAKGNYSHTEGLSSKALLDYCHAEGQQTTAEGRAAHSEGSGTQAKGWYSHAEGIGTTANGSSSHSEGSATKAIGKNSHSEGDRTEAKGDNSHAEGLVSKANGGASHAEGFRTIASGARSHAEGMDSNAIGEASHAEGSGTVANGSNQHTQGKYNIIDEEEKYAHIVGNGTTVDARSNAHTLDWEGNAWFAGKVTVGACNEELITKTSVETSITNIKTNIANFRADVNESFANSVKLQNGEGTNSIQFIDSSATGDYAYAEGFCTTSSGKGSHAEGNGTIASKLGAHAEGGTDRSLYSTASGENSHAEGGGSQAQGKNSHAEGRATTASGANAHAEGNVCTASGGNSHAEGQSSTSSGSHSHAEGVGTEAEGSASHAEGCVTKAEKDYSHAEGWDSSAKGTASHAEGVGTIATADGQHVEGRYNIEDTDKKYAHIVGVGVHSGSRRNGYTLDWNGNAWFAGKVYVGKEAKELATIEPPIETIPEILEVNKEYNFGEVASLSLVFPTVAENGDVIYLTFKSGATATTLTIDTTNTTDIEVIPEANCYYDIFAKYTNGIWLVDYNEYLVSEV